MIAPDATLREVAFAVGTALERERVLAVLCGGSAATFYAPDVYQSEDLDFVLTFDTDGALVKSAFVCARVRVQEPNVHPPRLTLHR